MTSPRPEEQALAGGMANAGAVVRVGDTVRRPVGPHSAAVHALLLHLEQVGFEGAPRFLGLDADRRAVLTYVDGDVGLPPYPAWTASESLLDSVALLQQRFHAAVASFDPPPDAVWDRTLASPATSTPTPRPTSDTLVAHNDLCLENVVCRGGRAVAFIDFDFAAPSDRLWDIAIAVRHWVPVRHPEDLDDARRGVDQVARLRRYCDLHGLTDQERGTVVDRLGVFLRQAYDQMRARYEAGLPAYVAVWENGYPGQNLRAQDWLTRHADDLSR